MAAESESEPNAVVLHALENCVQRALGIAERCGNHQWPADELDTVRKQIHRYLEILRDVTGFDAIASLATLEHLEKLLDGKLFELPLLPRKFLYVTIVEDVKGAHERVLLQIRSAEPSLDEALCLCRACQTIHKELNRPLVCRPSGVPLRLVQAVDDAYEHYNEYVCSTCDSTWTEDFNPDSDPSVIRWWPRRRTEPIAASRSVVASRSVKESWDACGTWLRRLLSRSYRRKQ